MLNFIFGGSGSGKSTLVSERIISDLKDNKKVILIVPEQQTLLSERLYTKLTEGVCALNFEVMNFSRISDAVFRKYGGLSYNYVSGGACRLLMWKTLETLSPVLSQFHGITLSDSAFIAKILDTVSELKGCGVTPEQLTAAAQASGEESSSLSGKLSDLALIYSAYSTLLKSGYDDPADDLSRLCEKLSEHSFFEDTCVYVDSFTGFSAVEYNVLSHIMKQAEQMTVSLCASGAISEKRRSSRADLFGEAHESAARLMRIAKSSGVSIGETVVLEGGVRFENEELCALEGNLFRFGCEPFVYQRDCEHIYAIGADGDFECAGMIAQRIQKRVIEDGLHYSDFAIIARDAEKYRGVIDVALERAGIPFFMSQKEKLTDKPIFKLVMAALSVVSGGWQLRDVVTYIKTGFTGLTPDEGFILENYASSWRINGKRWTDGIEWTMNPYGYTDRVNQRTEYILEEVNALRGRITPPLERLGDTLSGKITVKEAAKALFDYLCEIGVNEAVGGDICDAASWNATLESLDQLALVMPELEVDAESFRRMLAMVMGAAEIGRLPRGVDEVVIGSAPMLRVDRIKDVFIIGVNDGEFPAMAEQGGILSVRDIEALARAGIDLGFDGDLELDAELYFFYRAATAASENVAFFYTASEGGGGRGSYFCEHIKKLFPKYICAFGSLPEDTVWNYRESAEFALTHPQSAAGEVLRSMYEGDGKMLAVVESSSRSLSSEFDTVSESTAQSIFGGNLSMSQSRLETFEGCAFSYYCKYILKLEETRDPDFDRTDIGNFTHHILEKFIKSRAENGFDDIAKSDIKREIESIADEYISSVCGPREYLEERLTQLFSRLCSTTGAVCEDILCEMKQSKFRPSHFELPIGYKSEGGVCGAPIPIGDGSFANIVGRVDRVDTYEKDGVLYTRVVDYKTNTKKFSLDNISKGQDLQLLLYLFSIWKDKEKKLLSGSGSAREIAPAGVMYYKARISDTLVRDGYGSDMIPDKADGNIERSGLFLSDEEVLRAMDEKLEGKYIPVKMKSGEFSATSKVKSLEEFEAIRHGINSKVAQICTDMKSGKAFADDGLSRGLDSCKYCSMRPICRKTVR